MSVKIIIADDHKIMRDGLRNMLDKEAGLEVIAEANCNIHGSAGPAKWKITIKQ